MTLDDTATRLGELARTWNVRVERRDITNTAHLGFGTRDGVAVLLKVIRTGGDEWHSGEVLNAFGARGAVRCLEYAPGALLMEQALPGTLANALPIDDADDVVASVIQQMAETSLQGVPEVREWAGAFDRYIAQGDPRLPPVLVERAHTMFISLCDSQREPRLLHGDLHHYNVLFDEQRGWLVIDPKGVTGELAYELGAVLRNPHSRPELFGDAEIVCRRARRLAEQLALDAERVIHWAFAQAVLSVLWTLEDDVHRELDNEAFVLAHTLEDFLFR